MGCGEPINENGGLASCGSPSSDRLGNGFLDIDGGNLHAQVLLAVADGLVKALAAMISHGPNLLCLQFTLDGGSDRCSGDHWRTDPGLTFAADQQNAVKRDGLIRTFRFTGPVQENGVSRRDFELLALVFNNGVHVVFRFLLRGGDCDKRAEVVKGRFPTPGSIRVISPNADN